MSQRLSQRAVPGTAGTRFGRDTPSPAILRTQDNFLQVAALGIIEGVTEFLPISSTGHLLIAEQLGLGQRPEMWRDEGGIATGTHMSALGDRVKVTTRLDGAGELLAQFLRPSSMLRGVSRAAGWLSK